MGLGKERPMEIKEILPNKLRSLPKDAVEPLNIGQGVATGTGTLTPT